MKLSLVFTVLLLLSPALRASDTAIIYPTKTITDCANDLTRDMMDLDGKSAEKYCDDYSQETIDCARELAEARPLSYDFKKAIKDCSRKH